MQIHFLKMKQKNIKLHNLFICLMSILIASCSGNQSAGKKQFGKDENAVNSVLSDPDSLNNSPFVADRINAIKLALQQPKPVLLCKDSLDQNQSLAQ
jgi:hypothetical protein